MRAKGLLVGLVVYFLILCFGSLPACTYEDTTDEKVKEDGPVKETERVEKIEFDLKPNEMSKHYLIKGLI